MALPLTGQQLLMFVGDTYEDLELWYPKLRMLEAGARVVVAGPNAGQTYRGKHGYPCVADASINGLEAAAFHGLILPGGFMPDTLRRDASVLQLVRAFHANGKLIAAICHGGWIAISAGVYRGVRVTGSLGIKDDLVNAGAIWETRPSSSIAISSRVASRTTFRTSAAQSSACWQSNLLGRRALGRADQAEKKSARHALAMHWRQVRQPGEVSREPCQIAYPFFFQITPPRLSSSWFWCK